jgi:uncharacterized protein (UPF0276 family)
LEGRASVSWFEVVTENYLGDGGRAPAILERVRRDYPLAFHGVSMSLGSTDPLNRPYLSRLKRAISRFEPFIVSDHCCWTGVDGQNLPDLLPMPFTRQAARHVAARVSKVQDLLGRRILLENVSSYLTYPQDEMTEWEFLSEIVRASGCGLLLDVNNVYVSSVNHGFDPLSYLDGVPASSVGQIHLAGHTTRRLPDGRLFLIDTHDHPVCAGVWELYAQAVERYGAVGTMVEWDADIPEFSVLEAEIGRAKRIVETIQERVLEGSRASRAPASAEVRHHV